MARIKGPQNRKVRHKIYSRAKGFRGVRVPLRRLMKR